MKILYTVIFFISTASVFSQIRAIDGTPGPVTTSSAFLDASSSSTYDASANSAKGIAFPRVNLTAFNDFLGVNGSGSSFRNRYDGFIVYNTATSGVAGIGATEGTLSPGFWYYDNSAAGVGLGTEGGGTWRKVGGVAASIKSKTVTVVVPANPTEATLALGTGTIAANEVVTYLGAKIYDSTGANLVMTADADYNKATNLLTTGNGIFYQVLPAGTYQVVVEYR